MAQAADYFKMAATNLRTAVQLRKDEIAEIRKQIEQQETQMRENISGLHTQIREKQADITRRQDEQREPGKDRATKTRELVNMQGMISDNEHATSKFRSDALAQIADIEREIQSVISIASDLENRK